MTQKYFLSLSINFVVGIFLLINASYEDNSCSKKNMTMINLSNKNFKQYQKYYKYQNVEFLRFHYEWRGWIKYYSEEEWSLGIYDQIIDFKRDFQFRLKDSKSCPYFWCGCGAYYGIAVVLGINTLDNYRIDSLEELYLVQDLRKSLVIIFRFKKQSVTIVNCLKTSCNLRLIDSPNVENIIIHPYNKISEAGNLDMTITYSASQHSIKIYNNLDNENEILNYKDAYLMDELIENHGKGYLGLTATYILCDYKTDLINSYICVNGGQKITPTVLLSDGGQTKNPNEIINVSPSKLLSLRVEYKDKREKDLMGPGNFYINEEEYLRPPEETENTYTFEFYSKSSPSKYDIYYKTDHDIFYFSINVQNTEIKQLNFTYGEYEGEQKSYEIKDGIRYLKYGTLNGDFDLYIFNEENKFLYFYVVPEDDNHQPIDIIEIDKIEKKLMENSENVIIVEKVKDKLYKVGIKVTKKGHYSINNFLDYPIAFEVLDLVPSKQKSSCKIQKSKPIAYDRDEDVTFVCEFRDKDGINISIADAQNYKKIEIETNLARNEIPLKKIDGICSGSECSYTYKTVYNGFYKFETKFKNGEIEETIDSSLNSFYVSPEPITLEGCYIFNFDVGKWIQIEDTTSTIFNFWEDKDESDNLFMIDLVDSRDNEEEHTRYSQIAQPFAHLDITKIKGWILEEHSNFTQDISFEEYEWESNNYILAKLSDSKRKMRRSTLKYTIFIDFGIQKNLTLNYFLDIGKYEACAKDLDISSSIIETTRTDSLIAGQSRKVAELILKTDLEHLYNYFLSDEDEKKINFIEEQYNCINDRTCKIELFKTNIDGVYDIYFMSEKAKDLTIVAKFGNDNLKEGANSFSIKIEPIIEANSLEAIQPEEKNYRVENDIILEFRIKDRYGNIIDYDLPSDNFGLKATAKIDNEETTSNIRFEKGNSIYYIKETNRKSGNYTLIIENKNSKIKYDYYKGPGKASNLYSKIKVLNSNKLNLNEKSTAEIYLADQYDNKIDSGTDEFEREIVNVEIYAENVNDQKIDYNRENGNRFTSEAIEQTGNYLLFGKVYNEIVSCTSSCSFEVIYYGYDFSKSQLKMIGEKEIIMQKDNIYTLYEELQRPSFEFDFLTENGLPSNKIPQDTDIEAYIKEENEDEFNKLDKVWIDINKLIWTLKGDYSLIKDHKYIIRVSNKNTNNDYYLLILDYGEDKSDSTYKISNTFVSPNILYLKAGISDSFIVELRDENNLRYNKALELKKFYYTKFTDLEINPKLGNKNGQIIVEVKSNRVINYSNEIKISMGYNEQNIETLVQIIVASGDLAKFVIDQDCFEDPKENRLKPGTAGSSTKIKLYPYDEYNNPIQDNLFDSKLYSEESFSYLFNLKHDLGYKTSISSTTNSLYHTIELSLSTDKAGSLTLSSIYLDNNYKVEISAGAPSKYSKGYIKELPGRIKAGENRTFVIEPNDINGNAITKEEIIEEIKKYFEVKVYDLDGVRTIKPRGVVSGLIEYDIENKIAQTKVVEAFYNDEKIILNNNIINVVSGDASLDNSKLIYNGEKYSINDKIIISLASLPIIDLELYDEFGNKAEVSDNFEFKLIVGDNILSRQILYNKNLRLLIEDSKINDYFLINPSEDNCRLYIKIGEEEKMIDIDFKDASPEENKEAPVSFILNTDTLVQKAGENGTISITFYTEKGKQMGYFFDSPSKIEVSCNDDNSISKVLPSNNYGTYDIIISSETANDNITCFVNAINKRKSFKVEILPNEVEKCILSSDSSILEKAIAGEIYTLKFDCLDNYGNKAYLENEEFDALIKNPNGKIVEYNINTNPDNSLNLNVEPTIKGEYSINSYLIDNIIFTVSAGAISPENTYLKVDDSIVAGNNLNVDIHVLDKYNNPVELKVNDDVKKFILYHRTQDNSKYNDYDSIPNDNVEIIDKSIIRYKYQVSKAGINEFRGIYPKTSTIIRCENCNVKVESDTFDLNNSEVYRFNTFSKSYTILDKNNDALYNYEEDLLIKIYPKDQWGNKVNGKTLDIKVFIDEKELDKISSNEEFLEFREDKTEFSELKGQKELIIKYGEENITYFVNIIGKNDFDDDIEPANTKILEQNLEFTAGKYGYFTLELRNKNNARCKISEDIEIDIVTNSDFTNTTIFNQKSSVVFVLVTSTKSNTFPNKEILSLQVKVKNEPLPELYLFVKPGDLTTAKINEVNEDNELPSISVDDELRFSLMGQDSFGNDALINVDEAKLIVRNKNEISYKSSYVDFSSGKLYYIYDLTLSGEYEITEANEKLDLFNGITYTVVVGNGEICPEKSKVTIETPINAGNTASINISVKDKYNNDVTLNDLIVNDFSVFILPNNSDISSLERSYSGSSLKYQSKIYKVGEYQFNINYNGRKIKCEKLVVNPSECDPKKTLIYSKDKNGKYILFDKDDNDSYIYSSIVSPLSLRFEFRDTYSNIISDTEGINIENPNLHGNNMDPINWTYKINELYLDLTIYSNRKALEHLVTRTGEKAYHFSFNIIYESSSEPFDLKVNHFSKNEDGDEKYGNGDYNLTESEISTDKAEFIAGSSHDIFLTLRTNEGLIYNGDFDTSLINCNEISDNDDTFSCIPLKKETGIYIIRYYTSKYRTAEDKIFNTIILWNSDKTDSRIFEVLLVNKGGIPSKENTEIKTTLLPKIKADVEKPSISFILKDKFGNPINPNDIISKLQFENHDIPIKANIVPKPNSYEIDSQLEVSYPPKDISIQLYYVDNNIKLDLFEDLQKSVFEFTIDFDKCVVTSKNYNRMKAGEFLDLNIYTYDKYSQYFEDDDVTSSFRAIVFGPLGNNPQTKTFYFQRDNNHKYLYKIIIDETNYYNITGTYSITVQANEKNIATYSQTLFSGDIDFSKFVVKYIHLEEKSYDDQHIPVGELIQFNVQAYDKFGNKIDNVPLIPELFKILNNDGKEYMVTIYSGGNGALECLFTSTIAGSYKFNYFYDGEKISPDIENGPDEIAFVAGECSEVNPNIDYPEDNETDISVTYKYIIKCFDKYNNEVSKGGAKFSSKVYLYVEKSQSKIDIEPKIEDLENGEYAISFIPPLEGVYSIYTYLDGNKYDEKQFNLTAKDCSPDVKCPNDGTCKKNLTYCIPEKNRCKVGDIKKYPFRCTGSDECVDSMTKCKPENASQCLYMNASYPEGKSYLCSYYLPIDCKRKYPSYRQLCPDGICRQSKNLKPNQRVCPIGKILCADLTCKDNITECYNDWKECSGTQVRCPDQSCADDQKNCPTTITCSNPDDFVCPDGTCVENEIYCSKLKTCPDETPYLCTDNSCSNKPENCPHTVACGHGKSLCSDLICRETC